MKHLTLTQTVVAACALTSFSVVFSAEDFNGTPMSTPAHNASQITVTPQSKYFNVNGGDIVTFTLPDGRQFSWKFDGGTNYVNLEEIAPKGAPIPAQLRIYVNVDNQSGSDSSDDSSATTEESTEESNESSGSNEV